MRKIFAFAGSNSSTSINHKLLNYIEATINDPSFELVELRLLDVPIYGIDHEKELGIPPSVEELYTNIQDADILMMGCPEHNGDMPAYMKSTLDWLSRKDRTLFEDKQIVLCGTSPGRGGATRAMEKVQALIERLGGSVHSTFSLPSFNHIWEDEKLIAEHQENLHQFISNL